MAKVVCLSIVVFTLLSDVKKEKVLFLMGSWKYHFGLKTLGRGCIRHILLSDTPGYTYGGGI